MRRRFAGRRSLARSSAKVGEAVEVVLSVDTAPRTVTPPDDLQSALIASEGMEQAFGQLSYSQQKELVDWIAGAKKPETRARRIEKSLERLRTGQRLKG